MLEAFVLAFWLIWSADRDIYALTESLWFTILAVIIRQLTAFSIPEIDGHWAAVNGALWVYVAAVFMLVSRLSTSFMSTMLMAAAAGVGYFQLLQYLPDWVNGWMG